MSNPVLRVPGLDRPIFELPPSKSQQPSVFACSLFKAGSTLFYEILRDLCRDGDLVYVNLPAAFWDNGVDPARIPKSTADLFLPRGYCYGGFRNFPVEYDVPHFEHMTKLLLVRDIRDMAVSGYFSLAFSHPLPGASLGDQWRRDRERQRAEIRAMGVDRAALFLARNYRQTWRTYRELLGRHNFRIWRYEDVIYRKREWIAEIASHLGLPVRPESMEKLAQRVDLFPERENRDEFVRKVAPGDHKEKLSPRVIAKLERAFGDYLEAFGYQRGRRFLFGRRARAFRRSPDALGFENLP
jgi:hypothetical protein